MPLLVVVLLALLPTLLPAQQLKGMGTVRFHTPAGTERIQAASDRLLGVLNARTGSFAFSVRMDTYTGFGSQLQQQHFNDQYVQSRDYPYARYSGTVEGPIPTEDTSTPTRTTARGTFTLRGTARQLELPVTLQWQNGRLMCQASFALRLTDYGIPIPEPLAEKIGDSVDVEVNISLR